MRTVILAAGDFPKEGGAARRILAEAGRVVCCDGAGAEFRRQMCREPDVIVGDMDSIGATGAAEERDFAGTEGAAEERDRAGDNGAAAERGRAAEVVRVDEQETNDLAKAVRLCAERGWERPVILGATGKREDHTLGNIFRALEFGLEIVTDFGSFIPVEGEARLKVGAGAAVSVFATDPETVMTSQGLAWPLAGVRFANLYCATLNRATADEIRLTATRRVYVFVAAS